MLDHGCTEAVGAFEHAVAVAPHQVEIRLEVFVEERGTDDVPADVVDKQADLEVRGRFGELRHGVGGAEVHGDRPYLDAVPGPHFVRHRFEDGDPAGHDHDVHAASRADLMGEGCADSVRTTGHDSPFPILLFQDPSPCSVLDPYQVPAPGLMALSRLFVVQGMLAVAESSGFSAAVALAEPRRSRLPSRPSH